MADSRHHDGLSLRLLAGISIALLFGGLAVGAAMGGFLPLPYGSVAAIHRYVQTQSSALHVVAVAVFASSVPLAIYAATAGARLRRRGVTDAGPTIAVVGGTLAAGSLGLTGLLGWTLSRPEIAGDATTVRVLYMLAFLIGGPGHVVALGVLVAGIASGGTLPRATALIGIAIAALCLSATLVLAWTVLGPILPIARVAALVWLLVAGIRLTTRSAAAP